MRRANGLGFQVTAGEQGSLNKNGVNCIRSFPGRGIRVCDEWRGPDGYSLFLAHIGPRPSPEHSLDRIDNARGYEPGNVRWATQQVQTSNTRRNVYVSWRGERRTVAEWSRIVGLSRGMIHNRIERGWPADEALTVPAQSTWQWRRR